MSYENYDILKDIFDEKPPYTPKPDQNKITLVALYLACLGKQDEFLDCPKMEKLIFCADIGFFALTGKSITGEIYVKKGKNSADKEQGPSGSLINSILENLIEKDGKAERKHKQEIRKNGQSRTRHLFRLKDYSMHDFSELSDLEQETLKDCFEFFANESPSNINRYIIETYDLYRKIEDNQIIPYEIVFLSKQPSSSIEDLGKWLENKGR
jgi:hypothetical protein